MTMTRETWLSQLDTSRWNVDYVKLFDCWQCRHDFTDSARFEKQRHDCYVAMLIYNNITRNIRILFVILEYYW